MIQVVVPLSTASIFNGTLQQLVCVCDLMVASMGIAQLFAPNGPFNDAKPPCP